MIKIASIIALAAASAGVVLSNPVPDGHKPVIIGVPIINTTGVDSTIIRPRDDPNFLDYVSCYTLPEGNCHLVLVLAENNQNMGGLVINNICKPLLIPFLVLFSKENRQRRKHQYDICSNSA